MKNLLARIQEKGLTEVEYAGIKYRLRACVGDDLILQHMAILALLMPPNPGDLLTETTIQQADGPDREELERAYRRELIQRFQDPETQRRAHEVALAFLCAAVVAGDVGEGDGWEDLRIVAREQDQDPEAKPPRIWAANLPPGTIPHIGGIARELSYGGEENRNRIRSFRTKSGDGGTPGEARGDVRGSTERTLET